MPFNQLKMLPTGLIKEYQRQLLIDIQVNFEALKGYGAISPYELENEINLFYADVDFLVNAKLKPLEVFYFAALIHLVFVKVHPFNDGNGRTARLLEKWFLAQHLGKKAWFMQSEKHYYQHHQTYYQNTRLLELEYPLLDYSKGFTLPFNSSQFINN